MSDATTTPSFPRAPLVAAGAIIGFTLLGTAAVRLSGISISSVPASAPIVERDLRFEDRSDGAVTVYDARENKPIEVLVGQNGFLRATMRGLAQARLRDGEGKETPFRLTAWKDGRLTLDDPSTGRHVELAAFGPDNEAVFARLLPPLLGGAR